MSLSGSALAPGQHLGPYCIEARLGAGGMGDVYRATDTRLGRTVAVKVSRERFSERFEREAKAVSALNHPNICTLDDVGDGFLVMEYMEGETLAARLKRGKLPVREAADYAIQIAGALAAAHSKGITHRDLKPANVMIAGTGVKVLDFGLAHVEGDETLTAPDMVLGTPAYMAPEQREGKPCDARTDIYALGLILAEMLTGRRAPQGESPVLSAALPVELSHVVERCLATDPAERWQTAADLRRELIWASTLPPAPSAQQPAARRAATIAATLGAIAVITAGAILISSRLGMRVAPPPQQQRAQFVLATDDEGGTFSDSLPIPSPDGTQLLYLRTAPGKQPSLWIRPVDATELRALAGTEGAGQGLAWSPDGAWIAFHADGRLKKIPAAGGAPQTIADVAGFQDAAWGKGGDIIFRVRNREPLSRVRDSSGTPQPLTELDSGRAENSHRGPVFLPDGRRFLYTARCAKRENNSLLIASLDRPTAPKRLMAVHSKVKYVPAEGDRPEQLLFYSDDALVAVNFDSSREEIVGERRPLIPHVAYDAPSVLAHFQASGNANVIVVRSGGPTSGELAWYSRRGEKLSSLAATLDFSQPRISPDGSRAAFTAPDPKTGNRDVYVVEVARSAVSRVTTNIANDWFPVWKPDGSRLAFGSDRSGSVLNEVFLQIPSEPSDQADLLVQGIGSIRDWSSDGKWIAGGTQDIWIASTAPGSKAETYLATPFDEGGARFSPDNRWIAYVSNETGRYEVYIRPFTGGPAPAEGKIQISNGGGDYPVWRPGSSELFYLGTDLVLRSVDVQPLSASRRATPSVTTLFRVCEAGSQAMRPGIGNHHGYPYDTYDGQRFLFQCTTETKPPRYVAFLNWLQ